MMPALGKHPFPEIVQLLQTFLLSFLQLLGETALAYDLLVVQNLKHLRQDGNGKSQDLIYVDYILVILGAKFEMLQALGDGVVILMKQRGDVLIPQPDQGLIKGFEVLMLSYYTCPLHGGSILHMRQEIVGYSTTEWP